MNTWPTLPYGTRMKFASEQSRQTGQRVNPATIQVPWNVNIHVRKGLFCHSSAAIAAHVIHSNRNALQAGHTCPIRPINVIHQQPNTAGQMTHWWVCVNRPDRLVINESKSIDFSNTMDYAYLPFVGGFVVDIRGALWNEPWRNR